MADRTTKDPVSGQPTNTDPGPNIDDRIENGHPDTTDFHIKNLWKDRKAETADRKRLVDPFSPEAAYLAAPGAKEADLIGNQPAAETRPLVTTDVTNDTARQNPAPAAPAAATTETAGKK